MIEKTILDYDPVLKRKRMVHHDPLTGEFVLESQYDVSDVIERNKALMARTDERAGWKGDLHHVASIPIQEYYRLKRDGVIDAEGEVQGDKELAKLLNDPDNRGFRIRPGRI